MENVLDEVLTPEKFSNVCRICIKSNCKQLLSISTTVVEDLKLTSLFEYCLLEQVLG